VAPATDTQLKLDTCELDMCLPLTVHGYGTRKKQLKQCVIKNSGRQTGKESLRKKEIERISPVETVLYITTFLSLHIDTTYLSVCCNKPRTSLHVPRNIPGGPKK